VLFVRATRRDAGDGVRRHDRAFCAVQGCMPAQHLRQHEDGGGDDLRRQATPLQSRFFNVQPLLVEPVACTPASGWEKGQVENQVGLVRERLFTPRLRFKNFDELNAWLLDQCIATQGASPSGADRPDGSGRCSRRSGRSSFLCRPVRRIPRGAGVVSKTCLVRFDNNKILGGSERRRASRRGSCLCDAS